MPTRARPPPTASSGVRSGRRRSPAARRGGAAARTRASARRSSCRRPAWRRRGSHAAAPGCTCPSLPAARRAACRPCPRERGREGGREVVRRGGVGAGGGGSHGLRFGRRSKGPRPACRTSGGRRRSGRARLCMTTGPPYVDPPATRGDAAASGPGATGSQIIGTTGFRPRGGHRARSRVVTTRPPAPPPSSAGTPRRRRPGGNRRRSPPSRRGRSNAAQRGERGADRGEQDDVGEAVGDLQGGEFAPASSGADS